MCTLVSTQCQMSFLFQVLTATMLNYSLWHVFAILEEGLTLGLNSNVIFSGKRNSIISARTCKQSNVYILLIFATDLNFALFAEVQPIAIVIVYQHCIHSKTDKNVEFFRKFSTSERFLSLELIATLIKADSDSDNVPVRAPLPETVLATNTMSKHTTKQKRHKLEVFAILKFLKDLS